MEEKLILGIETSCDDTSVCLLRGEIGNYSNPPTILSHNFFSQETILRKWGGVVPEIAARNHLAKLVPLLEETFSKAKLGPKDIDLIGVTTHPGLLGPLLTGLNAAKTLSMLIKVPIYSVNHLYAHMEAIHLSEKISYPYLGLLVSGGHSLFLLVNSAYDFEILGSTTDDAAGEAFDKGGKLMGLEYPAGKEIDQLAKSGDPSRFKFPIGLVNSKDANLSYSGVKTSLRSFLLKHPKLVKDKGKDMQDLCASYQHAIVEALALKLNFALSMACQNKKKIPIVVGGGVACNSYLRSILEERYNDLYFVKPQFCTDNGAMIANYALRCFNDGIKFPDCLYLDAKGKFISHQRSTIKETPL